MRLTLFKSTLDTLSGIVQPDCSDHSILKIRGLAVFSIVDMYIVYNQTSSPNNAIAQTCAFFRYGISPEEVNIALEFNYHYRADVDRDRETHKLALAAEKETMKQESLVTGVCKICSEHVELIGGNTCSICFSQETIPVYHLDTKQKETMKQQQPEEETFIISIVKGTGNRRDLKKVIVTKTQLEKIKEYISNHPDYWIVTHAEDVTDEIMRECFPETIKITVDISEHYNGETVVPPTYDALNNFMRNMM